MKNLIKLLVVAVPLAFSLSANAQDAIKGVVTGTPIGTTYSHNFSNGLSHRDGLVFTDTLRFTLGTASIVTGFFADNRPILSGNFGIALNKVLNGGLVGSDFVFLEQDVAGLGNPPPFSITRNLAAGEYQFVYKRLLLDNAFTGKFTVTAAVPEPETYALMLAGLALVGFTARRRQA